MALQIPPEAEADGIDATEAGLAAESHEFAADGHHGLPKWLDISQKQDSENRTPGHSPDDLGHTYMDDMDLSPLSSRQSLAMRHSGSNNTIVQKDGDVPAAEAKNKKKSLFKKTASHLFLRNKLLSKASGAKEHVPGGSEQRSSFDGAANGDDPDSNPTSPTSGTYDGLPRSYKGFHASRMNAPMNVPPLKQPIQPSFKRGARKRPSLLNKFIGKRNSEISVDDDEDGAAGSDDERVRHNSSASSLKPHRKTIFNLVYLLKLKPGSVSGSSTAGSVSGPSKPSIFDIDINTDSLIGVVNPELSQKPGSPKKSVLEPGDEKRRSSSNWKPPESWAVSKEDTKSDFSYSFSRNDSVVENYDDLTDPLNKSPYKVEPAKPHQDSNPISFNNYKMEAKSTQFLSHQPNKELSMLEMVVKLKGRYILKIFKADGTFTTLSLPIQTTVTQILHNCAKKFFLDNPHFYQITLQMGGTLKVLQGTERPLEVQNYMLLLAGYDVRRDNLRFIGGEDLSYLCKFVLESNDINHKNNLDEEKIDAIKDYGSVVLKSMNLNVIPIEFYQHTYEIEELDVSCNPSISLPTDFMASCNILKKLSFDHNRAQEFPMSVIEAKKLTRLDIGNNFIKKIPDTLGSLKYLTKLYLNDNDIDVLPREFSNLRSLKILNLSLNKFKVFPEPITQLDELVILDLSFNQIEVIPKSITNLQNLEDFNIATNCLGYSLPDYLSQLRRMKSINVQYNNITNLDSLGLMPNLEVLSASKNTISKVNFRALKFRTFLLDRNPIVEIPSSDVLFENLTTMNLSKAKLTSLTNDDLVRLHNLETLILDKNQLTFLPSRIGSLTNLIYLSAYANDLKSIPESIGELRNLQFLDLHRNSIKEVPGTIWNCLLLRLNLSSNLIQLFPSNGAAGSRAASRVGSQSGLEGSQHSSSRSDSEPRLPVTRGNRSDSLRGISGVTESITSSLSGSIISEESPSNLAMALQFLSIADNLLTDESFEPISMFQSLKSLNVSYNRLVEIPPGVFNRLKNLIDLYLSGNELMTFSRDDLLQLRFLRVLYLNNNRLNSLPSEIRNMRQLAIADMGSNQLRYNVRNYRFEWNWQFNIELRYLNFSGNNRFELFNRYDTLSSTQQNAPVDLDGFDLKHLKILGLIGVTIGNGDLPDENINTRVRTTATEINNYGYGIADSLGQSELLNTREMILNNVSEDRDDELLLCLIDGKDGPHKNSNRVCMIIHEEFKRCFVNELKKLHGSESVEDAIRRTFLGLNREIHKVVAEADSVVDSGCCITICYIRGLELYLANVGDSMGLISKSDGEYQMLTEKHNPTIRKEFERIRLSGGYINSKGELDGVVDVSRLAGFLSLLPHIHAKPFINKIHLTSNYEMLIVATSQLWDYISPGLAMDIISQYRKDPMVAAQKLRDLAISYGAKDKLTVIVLSLNIKKNTNGTRLSITEESLLPLRQKRRNDTYDTNLVRLNNEIKAPVGALALVFTDIQNSTSLWDNYSSAMRLAIKLHNLILRRLLRIVGGYEVKTEGDAFMVSFPTPFSALVWCFNVQQQLISADWPAEILESTEGCVITDSSNQDVIYRGLRVRMGIHWGSPNCWPDAVTDRMDYFGLMVNRASRVMLVADGGQISISNDFLKQFNKLVEIHKQVQLGQKTVKDAYGDSQVGRILEDQIAGLNSIGYVFEELGEMKLKGLEALEFITLIFPEKLKGRRLFVGEAKEASPDGKPAEGSKGLLGGLIKYENLKELQVVAVKLEHLNSVATGGTSRNDDIVGSDKARTKALLLRMFSCPNICTEAEYTMLLDSLVTRIENSVRALEATSPRQFQT